MKTLIIVVLLLIIYKTSSFEELAGLFALTATIQDIGHSREKIDDLDRWVKYFEPSPSPTPWPTSTPTLVRYE